MLEPRITDQLRKLGFVHVTGLPQKDEKGRVKLVQAKKSELGSYDRAAAMTATRIRFMIITLEGEVWIFGGDNELSFDFLEEVCPEGRKPKADSWPTFFHLNADDVLQRIRDPYWDYHGEYSPEPKPIA